MRVLFVTMQPFENNDSVTIQNKGIVRGLSSIGHDVDTLTLLPNQKVSSYDESVNDISDIIKNSYYIDINPRYAMLMSKKDDNKKITQTNKNIIKNILRYGRRLMKCFYDSISIFDAKKVNVKGISKLNINYGNYDIIISASDPKSSHLLVDRILRDNKGCKAKWIQYWGDPMLYDITRISNWRDRLVKYHENKLIAKADKVIYASPFTLEKQKETFPNLAFKMDYANQAFAYIRNKTLNDTSSVKKDNVTVGYYGAYPSTIRNIMPLYNAAKGGNYKLTICGSSDLLLENTNNVTVKGTVTYKEAVLMEEESDILVCICNLRGSQIPGKIYYCASYNKPIVVILDSEYKEKLRVYLESFNRFILCENNEYSIKNAIEQAKVELKVKEFIISEQLTPEYMAQRILGCIEV